MPRSIEPRFERLARRLTSLQLRADDLDLDDLGLALGLDARRGRAFVDTYTVAGLRTALEHYGLHAKLVARGHADYEIVVTEEDPFHHRLQLLMPGGEQLVDLRLHLGRLSRTDDPADVVAIEWLLMQDPLASFSDERPRLPGQRHPGLGIGGDVAQLLVLMCRRIAREGLVIVAERFHLAELYAKRGWLAPNPATDGLIDEVTLAAPLSFQARAWAMERGCVFDEHGAPVVYVPEERVLPVSDRLQKALAPGGSWLRTLFEPRRRLRIDLAKLRASLTEEPVEGMDPDALES